MQHLNYHMQLKGTLYRDDQLLEFAALGSYCQFDLFGNECSFYQINPATDMPSDAQRIQKIMQLIEEKRNDRILIAHDIHTKHRLIQFGGHGYSHILNSVIPKMLIKGISQRDIDMITVENPKTWLQYKIRQ